MTVRPLHWVARFVASLWPGRPSDDRRRTADAWLSEPERALFARMSGPDQRHALAVARAVEARLDELDPDWRRDAMAAALLHDVGKTSAGLGTYGRAVATLCGAVAPDMARAWQSSSGFTRKVGLYLRYGEVGADLLTMVQSSPWVVAWSTEHHCPRESWTVPPLFGQILIEADR